MLRRRRNLNRAATIAATMGFVVVAASLFTLTLYPERSWVTSVLVGSESGLLIGTPIVLWLLLGVETRLGRWLKRLPLLVYLTINGVFMSAILVAGHLTAYHLVWPYSGRFLDDPDLPASLFFSIALVVVISFSVELRRLIGPGVFGAVLAGRYRHPRREHRVFLLLDLVGSTGIAERLGPERFLAFLDRWIHGLTEPLLVSKGLIYRYVGDEVILTWERTADAPARALGFAVDAAAAVAGSAESWRRDFGIAPSMRTVLHGGPVVTGEIGDVKREITFLGDTLNTAARIAEEARKHDCLVLASAEALAGINLPEGLVAHALGPVPLRGKAEPVALVLLRTGN